MSQKKDPAAVLAELSKAYAALCDMFCKDPNKVDAYRDAVELTRGV
jgi:hypothetical protein